MENKIVEGYVKHVLAQLKTIKERDDKDLISEFCSYAANLAASTTNTEVKEDKKYEKRIQDVYDNILLSTANTVTALVQEGIYRDILADVFEAIDLKRKDLAQVFSPASVSKTLSELTLPDEKIKFTIKEHGYIKLLEPTIGTGRLVFSYAQRLSDLGYVPYRHMYIEGWDVDYRASDVAYLQLYLYAIPATIITGDTLDKTINRKRCTLNFMSA